VAPADDAPARRTRRGAETETAPASDEAPDEPGLWRRRGAETGGAPAPHASDPPAAPPEADPDRTQALDPADGPREDA
jgi:hypothetical protein